MKLDLEMDWPRRMIRMERHAYLIIAHNDLNLLNKLLSCLDDERNWIFIHIDKKSDLKIEDIYVPIIAKCNYIERRKVTWGGYSQIEVEVELIETAVKSYGFEYLHLLSGQDLPLKTIDEIYEYFTAHKGENFISLDPNPDNQKSAVERISKYWLFQDKIGRKSGIKFILPRVADILCRKVQVLFNIDRTKKIPIKIYKGTNWFSITGDMAKEVLKYKKYLKKWFGWSVCADELFLQTIAYNSSFKDTIVNSSLRKIDWERGNPYTYTIDDEKLLLECNELFARKFSSEIDNDIIERIYFRVKNGK